MKENLFTKLEKLLKSDEKYQADGKRLLKAKVHEDAMKLNHDLLKLLLSDEEIKNAFFTQVNEMLAFDKQKFAWLIKSKEFLPDSFTRFSNKIGLSTNDEQLAKNSSVVLEFPHKDCFLQGGQDKDEQKRNEIFYHETIAINEVNRMLSLKVLSDAKRFNEGGGVKKISPLKMMII